MICLMKLLKSWIPASWIIWVPDPLAQRATISLTTGLSSWRLFFQIPICQRIFGASNSSRFLIPDLQFLDPGSLAGSLEISKFLTLTMLNQFYPKNARPQGPWTDPSAFYWVTGEKLETDWPGWGGYGLASLSTNLLEGLPVKQPHLEAFLEGGEKWVGMGGKWSGRIVEA